MSYNPTNPNGQATSANSAPVVLASNQSTIPTSTLSSTLNATPTGISALNGDLIPSVDVSAYKTIMYQITGTWVGTITPQGSDDNVTFSTLTSYDIVGDSTTNAITGNNIYQQTVQAKYFRLRMTSYTSGTATAVYTLSSLPPTFFVKNINAGGLGAVAGTVNSFDSIPVAGADGGGLKRHLLVDTSGRPQGNVAQINGITPLMGNGVTGTGSQRVTIASDNTVLPSVGAGATGSAIPANASYMGVNNAGNLAGVNASGNTGDANGGSGMVPTSLNTFNNTTYDRYRGNFNVNTGDTGAKTATGNGATQTNYNASGANILFNIGTVSGTTPTLVFKLQGSSDGGTTFYDIPGASTASITATGTALLSVYPGVTVAANAAVSFPLPRTWRVVWTIGGTTPSFTITNIQVGYIL
jgi:hypothetical protein